ncbi:MAG: biotin--[acetyl-CoA-carboxylase] ligase [Woeseiaceae bacterium]|nr:biotin--[acetyl-CoA-carboxylase] ligase [Woeseiaceae bacterium]
MAAFDSDAIRSALNERVAGRLQRIDAFEQIDSTNTFLIGEAAPEPGRCKVAITDHQTAGRGRRDNRWHSEPGRSLCLSMAYRFDATPASLPTLTLAQGVGIVRSLVELGASELRLKWPNDIVLSKAKLGGILTETQFRDQNSVTVVTGVGINLAPVAVDLSEGGWSGAIASLDAATTGGPDRFRVAVAVIEAMADTFVEFEREGFASFRDEFKRYDGLEGSHVEMDVEDGELTGQVLGIDDDGALLVDTGERTISVISGSIRRILEPATL